jgi:AMP-polyphosphate phosphotransferase
MFETAEIGCSIDPRTYRKESVRLREELLRLQDEFRHRSNRQFVLLLAGVDGAGKGETVKLLNQWMDPRWLQTNAYDQEEANNHHRPEFWMYWRDLPARGRIGMFLSAWYSRPILDHVYERIDDAVFEMALTRILRFEQALADDGAVVLKLWMHLGQEAQESRLKNLEGDPLTEARVTRQDWHNWRNYARFVDTAERAISRTHTGSTPWVIIEGSEGNYRDLTVGNTLCLHLRRALEAVTDTGNEPGPDPGGHAARKKTESRTKGRAFATSSSRLTVLSQLDMTATQDAKDYKERLPALQADLHRLHLKARQRGIASMLVFEGPDAAGKGGAIRRIGTALEARNYQVHGVAKPTEEELARHYLWRFWRNVPGNGYIAIFDRSWYGRVLVERVEGFASLEEWRRAYGEINDFEKQLTEHGIVLVKFWLHITREEQLRRFKEREKIPHKRWKLTEEDWRNRKKWKQYEQAAHDMVQYTSTSNARWSLVEGNDKRHARIVVLQTLVDHLRRALGE